GPQRFSGVKATDETKCHKCGRNGHFARDCFSKTPVPSYSSPFQAPKSSMVKNKGLVAEAYKWDEEEVSSYDNKMVKVKVLMALADDENVAVGKESARNSEWVKIFTRKIHTLLEMEDNDERKTFIDYLCIDLNYAEEQRNNLLFKT
ncbi:retrovirus-related pol polyprotein from transposon TNT 1-94, partial [Tanacetum coccineum]